jgi:hypothetical protein
MSVSDRVMEGDLNATYNLDRINEIMDGDEPNDLGGLEFPSDMNVGDDGMPELMAETGLRNGHLIVIDNMLDRQDHGDSLDDNEEHGLFTQLFFSHNITGIDRIILVHYLLL